MKHNQPRSSQMVFSPQHFFSAYQDCPNQIPIQSGKLTVVPKFRLGFARAGTGACLLTWGYRPVRRSCSEIFDWVQNANCWWRQINAPADRDLLTSGTGPSSHDLLNSDGFVLPKINRPGSSRTAELSGSSSHDYWVREAGNGRDVTMACGGVPINIIRYLYLSLRLCSCKVDCLIIIIVAVRFYIFWVGCISWLHWWYWMAVST